MEHAPLHDICPALLHELDASHSAQKAPDEVQPTGQSSQIPVTFEVVHMNGTVPDPPALVHVKPQVDLTNSAKLQKLLPHRLLFETSHDWDLTNPIQKDRIKERATHAGIACQEKHTRPQPCLALPISNHK